MAGDLTDQTGEDAAPAQHAIDDESTVTSNAEAVAAHDDSASDLGGADEAVRAEDTTDTTDAEDTDAAKEGTEDTDEGTEDTDDNKDTKEDTEETAAAESSQPKPGKKRKRRGRSGKAAKSPKAAKPSKPKKPRRKFGRRAAAVVVGLVATLFVGSAAFAGAMVQPYLSATATVEIKEKVARAAKDAVTALFSYTPEDVDRLSDRAGRYLGGDFGARYRAFVEPIVAPTKQTKITTSTVVAGIAVESLQLPNAVVIVYANTTTTTPLKKNIPTMQYKSLRLQMKREHDKWLVTSMNTVTSLDVTPQL
nr:mammalian cell entry protein [Mycobacterium vicinigordonae]